MALCLDENPLSHAHFEFFDGVADPRGPVEVASRPTLKLLCKDEEQARVRQEAQVLVASDSLKQGRQWSWCP